MLDHQHFHAGSESAVESSGKRRVISAIKGETVKVSTLDKEEEKRQMTGFGFIFEQFQLS